MDELLKIIDNLLRIGSSHWNIDISQGDSIISTYTTENASIFYLLGATKYLTFTSIRIGTLWEVITGYFGQEMNVEFVIFHKIYNFSQSIKLGSENVSHNFDPYLWVNERYQKYRIHEKHALKYNEKA